MKKITLHNKALSFSAQYYGADNTTAPLILCLHGFPDNANSFRYQIDDFLDAGFRVLIPTMRGYEPSSIPHDNSFSLDEIAGDVIA